VGIDEQNILIARNFIERYKLVYRDNFKVLGLVTERDEKIKKPVDAQSKVFDSMLTAFNSYIHLCLEFNAFDNEQWTHRIEKASLSMDKLLTQSGFGVNIGIDKNGVFLANRENLAKRGNQSNTVISPMYNSNTGKVSEIGYGIGSRLANPREMTESRKKELARKKRYYDKNIDLMRDFQNRWDAEHRVYNRMKNRFYYMLKTGVLTRLNNIAYDPKLRKHNKTQIFQEHSIEEEA
jgi:hypothetical protein